MKSRSRDGLATKGLSWMYTPKRDHDAPRPSTSDRQYFQVLKVAEGPEEKDQRLKSDGSAWSEIKT